MTWQLASLLRARRSAWRPASRWYERDKPPARVLALVATLAALAVVGRLAFAADPERQADHRHRAVRRLRARGGAGLRGRGDRRARLEHLPLAGALDALADGRLGRGRRRRRRARPRAARAASPTASCWRRSAGSPGSPSAPGWTSTSSRWPRTRTSTPTWPCPPPRCPTTSLTRSETWCSACLIGPVFIRALRRYRRRLEVRWLAPGGARPLALALACSLPAAAGAVAGRAAPSAGSPRPRTRDGGFGAAPGAGVEPALQRLGRRSGWRRAGRNPRDLKRRGGRSLAAYVTARRAARSSDIGEVERTVLRADARPGCRRATSAAATWSQLILRRRRGDGSIAGYVSYTAFGVLALRSAGVSPGRQTVAWLVAAAERRRRLRRRARVGQRQRHDRRDAPGARGGGPPARRRSTQRAVAWLRANQNDDGGFGQFTRPRLERAVDRLRGPGPGRRRAPGGATLTRALGYLRGLQRGDGSVAYSSTSNQTPVWVTAQALMALRAQAAADRRRARASAAQALKPKPEPAAAPAASPQAASASRSRGATGERRPSPARTSGTRAAVDDARRRRRPPSSSTARRAATRTTPACRRGSFAVAVPGRARPAVLAAPPQAGPGALA